MLLSRIIAARGKILESLFVLAEGIKNGASPQVADELIHRYAIWLSDMESTGAKMQLKEIALALGGKSDKTQSDKTQSDKTQSDESNIKRMSQVDISLSDGTTIRLPAIVGDFHQALLDGDGRWLMPLLLGTDRATRGDFEQATEYLQAAVEESPNNPVIANNLAWTLLQHAVSPQRLGTQDPAELDRAWELASTAVEKCPENVSFRETRGTIAVELKYWNIAASDLQFCSDSGHNTRSVKRHLETAKTRSTTHSN